MVRDHTHAAGVPPRLRGAVPRLAPEELAAVLAGQARRLHRCTAATQDVLAALVSHAGWHSDRVWASEERLADLAGCSTRTVRRALRWMRLHLGLRLVSDSAELRRGPGPHAYAGETRGDGPVNCWDLAALRRLVPDALLASAPAVAPPPRDDPDPFSLPLSPETPHQTSHRADTPDTDAVCFVGGVGEKANGKTEERRSGGPPFARPSLAGGIEEGNPPGAAASADKNVPDSAAAAASAAADTVFAALVRAGILPPIARRMRDERGDLWCRQLLAYGRWQRAHARVGGGWYCRTWQQWESWPDAFEQWWERERTAARRTVRAPRAPDAPDAPRALAPSAHPASLVSPMAAPSPLPPPCAADPRPERADEDRHEDGAAAGSPAGEDPLLAQLTAAARAALRERAEQELHCTLPGAPPALIRALTPKRMRSIWEQERGGAAVHDTGGGSAA